MTPGLGIGLALPINSVIGTGGPSASPGDLSGLFCWYRPEDLPAVAQVVSIWPDSSPNSPNNDLLQGVQASRPLVTAGPDGKRAASFDGIDDFLLASTGTIGSAQPFYSWIVAKTNAAIIDNAKYFQFGTPANESKTFGGGYTRIFASAHLSSTAGDSPLGVGHVIRAFFNGANSQTLRNGVQIALGNAGTSGIDAGQGFNLSRNAGGSVYSQLEICELFMANGVTAGELADMESYLTGRYPTVYAGGW